MSFYTGARTKKFVCLKRRRWHEQSIKNESFRSQNKPKGGLSLLLGIKYVYSTWLQACKKRRNSPRIIYNKILNFPQKNFMATSWPQLTLDSATVYASKHFHRGEPRREINWLRSLLGREKGISAQRAFIARRTQQAGKHAERNPRI